MNFFKGGRRGGRKKNRLHYMPHNALHHTEPSISSLSTDTFTDPNSAICAKLSPRKQCTRQRSGSRSRLRRKEKVRDLKKGRMRTITYDIGWDHRLHYMHHDWTRKGGWGWGQGERKRCAIRSERNVTTGRSGWSAQACTHRSQLGKLWVPRVEMAAGQTQQTV